MPETTSYTIDPADDRFVFVDGRRLARVAGAEDPPAGDPPAGDPPAGDPPAGDPPATDPKPDEQLGDAGKKALAAERKARADAEKAARDALAKVKEYEDRDKTDAEKLAERATTAEERASTAEAKALRLEVALEKNVPADLRDFLTGSTREEVEAKADALLAHLKPSGGATPPPGSFDGGARPPAGGDGEKATLPQQIAAAEKAGDKALVMRLKTVQLAQKMAGNTTS